MVMLKNQLAVQRKLRCSFPVAPKPGLFPTHVQFIRACPGCCWGQTWVNRVYIANLVRKWFGHLSLMPNGCSYSLCEWGEFHWAILSELRTWKRPSSVQDSCSHRSAPCACSCSASHRLLPSSLLPKARNTPVTRPLTADRDLSHQNTSGLFHALFSFVTCLKRSERKLCIMVELYKINISKYISKASSHTSNQVSKICVNSSAYFLGTVFFSVIGTF